MWRLEDRLDYTCFLCTLHCMSSYFRDHTNCLVRVDPLRNLPLGYLTLSLTRSSLIDLPRFSLVDIEPIPMDHHKQNPLGYVLGEAQNGQHEVNKEIKEHERASNAGEVEAQMRIMRDYMNLTRQTPISAIVLSAYHTTLNLKLEMLQALLQFHGYESERPYMHLKIFEDACSIFQDNSCPREVLLLKFFPFTLKDKTRLWFNSLRPMSIYSWNTLKGEFLKKFFPKNLTEALRRAISQFVPNSGESFFQA